MAKKYYWLKLKNTFFNQVEIKLLRRIAGGDTYTVVYLKMMLLSLEDEGAMFFDNVADNFVDELAIKLDEDPENVQVTLNYLQNKGLLEIRDGDEYFLCEVPTMIGKETDGAVRQRKHRKKIKETDLLQSNGQALQSNSDVTQSKSKEIDLKKDNTSVKSKDITPSFQDGESAFQKITLKNIGDDLINYYAETYIDYFGKEHPLIPIDRMEGLVTEIHQQEFRDCYFENKIDLYNLIDYHFEHLPTKNDGKIYGFLHEGYRSRIAEEMIKKTEVAANER